MAPLNERPKVHWSCRIVGRFLRLLPLFFPTRSATEIYFHKRYPAMISLDHLGGGGSAWWIDGWLRRFINPIYTCPSSPRSNGSRRNFFRECARCTYTTRPRERIFLVYSRYVMAKRKKNRFKYVNPFNIDGRFKEFGRRGEIRSFVRTMRFRFVEREKKTGSPELTEDFPLTIRCLPVIDYPLDIGWGSNVW